jgi:hypothetical protein
MKKIVHFAFYYSPGGRGRVQFQLEGEDILRAVDLEPDQLAVVAGLLSQNRAAYDTANRSFVAYSRDENHINT